MKLSEEKKNIRNLLKSDFDGGKGEGGFIKRN